MLHSGHVAFFQTAASYGDLIVALGSDKTVFDLKGRAPINTEQERLFMVQSVASVKQAFISQGSGMLDFLSELEEIHPDMFIVNEEGNTPDKAAVCAELQIEYLILKRDPASGLVPRSTTALRKIINVPFRIDLAGGWLDQPWLSEKCPGSVITISLEPTIDFNERSGMASSTRLTAIDLWGPRLPVGDYAKLAKMLFCYDNPPGTQEVSGSQDAIGIVFPGLNKAFYEGKYWPSKIDSVQDERVLQFVEQALYLVPLGPRHAGYSVLSETYITPTGAQSLAVAAESCWQAALNKDLPEFGRHFRASFEAQIAMFPHMVNPLIMDLIAKYQNRALGWKLSGAGGGGYLILVADKPVENSIRVNIRRVDS